MAAIPYKDRQITYTRIRQKLQGKKLVNIQDKLREELVSLSQTIEKDADIAIGVGSRGINNIQLIVT